jgi:AcrR family transcriptional regulator
MKKRKYRLKQRAARQQETRERIVDAAVALHEELGPAATTISALADRAGVQRLTVYRHFQSEQELLKACSSKWLSRHPPPDVSKMKDREPVERTRATFRALYDYYSETQGMWNSLYRDLGKVAALDEAMSRFDEYLAALAESVLGDWAPCKSKRLRATIGHSLRFSTWQSLKEQGLGRTAMAELVGSWIEAAGSRIKGKTNEIP